MQPSIPRPLTNYLDMPMPGTLWSRFCPDDIDVHGGDPSDLDLDHAVQEVLRSAGLSSITEDIWDPEIPVVRRNVGIRETATK
jgi:chitin synthase